MGAILQSFLPKATTWCTKVATMYVSHKITHPQVEEPPYLKNAKKAVGSEENEIIVIQSHIKTARLAWEDGNQERAREELNDAISASHCERCIRGMTRVLNSSDVEGNLKALENMIPAYYKIMHDEEASKLDKKIVTHDGEKEGGDGKAAPQKLVVVPACEACAANEVLELCNYEPECMKKVLDWIEEQQKDGGKVLEEDLLAKAKEFKGKEN